jgi:hypothetical protein
LIIDTDAKLTFAVAVERFQSIAAECCKIVQIACSLKAIKPGFRLPCKTRKIFDVIAFGKAFRPFVPEAHDHA